MVIGVDFGFGHIKYAYNSDSGMEVGKIPSVVAELDSSVMEKLESIENNKRDKDMFIYNGRAYYVGEICHYKDNKNDIEKYEDLERFAPLFLASIFQKNGINPSECKVLSLCLAPVHYAHKDEFIQKVKSFEVNGVEYNFEDVIVLQQGACAKDVIEKQREKNDKSEDYMIVDIGFNTLDVCVVLNGEVKNSNLAKDSIENFGVIKMANRVQNEAKKQLDTKKISAKDSMCIIVDKSFRFRGSIHDFSDLVESEKQNYFTEIKNYLEKEYETYIDRLQSIYLIGGGSYYIDAYEKHFIKFDDNAEYFNALGCLLQANKNPKKKNK